MLILAPRIEFCNSQIVSTLASCGRLPATVPDLANRPRQLVFLTPIDSQLNDFLNEIHQIARFEPSIVERIDEDLDLHAKKKKLLRLADAEFLAGQTLDLPKLQLQLRELEIDKIELETGRPRTDAYIVYLFLMLRGFNGGCKDQHARLMLQESIAQVAVHDRHRSTGSLRKSLMYGSLAQWLHPRRGFCSTPLTYHQSPQPERC